MNRPQFQSAPRGYASSRRGRAPQETPKIPACVRTLIDYDQRSCIQMRQFRDLYGDGKIGADNAFIMEHDDTATWRKYHTSPQRLTSSMLVGALGEQNWLGLSDTQATSLAWSATDYDLFLSYTNAIGEVCFATPVHDSVTGVTRQQIHFALDIASSFSQGKLLGFLTRSNTSKNTALPFGFTYPEYVLSGQSPLGSVLMPRYCVSVGHACAVKLRDLIVDRAERAPYNYASPIMLLCRYRILLLMQLQNQLYQTMLPDPDHYGRQAPMLTEVEMILDQMDGILRSALDQTIMAIVKQNLVPIRIREKLIKLQSQGRHQAVRDLVRNWQLAQVQTQFAQHRDERRNPVKLKDDEGDTFIQLMKISQQLLDAAYAGQLDHFRTPCPRNQAIPMRAILK